MPAEPTVPSLTVVVMGVSGSGKSTIARLLAEPRGWAFAEGDDLHPPANVAKMRAGVPLDDDDRFPWLRAVAGWIGEQETAGRNAVITCSALRRRYRDLLREGHPSVWFAHVTAEPAATGQRLAERSGHYMPATLLPSQLAALEPLDDVEPGVELSNDGDPRDVAARFLQLLASAGAPVPP